MNRKCVKPSLFFLGMLSYSGLLQADTSAMVESQVTQNLSTELDKNEADLATQQLELETGSEEMRLAEERQQQVEQALADRIGETPLQFKSLIAKIYAENNFAPLWTDVQAKQQFLHDYALMVAAGISKRSAEALNAAHRIAGNGALIEDILLTDAFLDYLYYANNVQRSAQKWLYSENSYKAGKPDENQIAAWLSAVKNNDHLAFVKNLSSDNPLFQQTLDRVKALIAKGVEKNKTTELHRFAINAQRLRILPAFENGIFVNIPSYQLTYYRNG